MARTAYIELLRDPRWQRRRLEILERDDFACTSCSDKRSTLHVHHGYYERDVDPWDYPSDSLHTLCEACHTVVTKQQKELRVLLGKLPQNWLQEVAGYVIGCLMMSHRNGGSIPREVTELEPFDSSGPIAGYLNGMLRVFGFDHEEMLAVTANGPFTIADVLEAAERMWAQRNRRRLSAASGEEDSE